MKFKNLFSERTVMAMESIRMRVARAGRIVMRPLCNAVVLKKTVSMLIVACLVVNLLPVGAFAEDPISQEMENKEEKNISTGYVPQGTSDMQTAVAGLEVSVGENGVLKTSDGTIVGSLSENGDGKWVAMVQPQYAKSIGASGNKKGDQSLVAVGLDKLNMKAKGQAAEIYKAAIAQSQKKNTQSGQPTVASQREQGDDKQDGAREKDRELSRKDGAQEKQDHRIRDSGEASSTKRSQVDEQSGSEKKDKMLQAIKKKPGDSADVSYISLTMLQEKVAEAGLQFIADRDPAFMGEEKTQGFAHFTGDNGSALFVAVAAGQMAYAVPDADGSGKINVTETENTIKTDAVEYAFSGIVLKAGDPKDENTNINKDGTKGIFFDSEIQAVKGMEGVALENAASMSPETEQGVVDALSSLFNSILNGIALTDAQQALLSTLGVSADSLKKLGADYLNKAVAYLQNVINNGGTVINCAVDALGAVLNNINKGVLALQAFLVDIASGNFLKNQAIDGQVMTSMDAIRNVAAANGTDMTAFGVSQEEFWGNLQKMISAGQDGQFVLHIDGNHFVTVDLKDGVLSFKDSLTGDTKTNLSLDDLKNLLNARFKDGTVNLLTTNASFASKQNKLTENQMKAIVGAMSVAEAQTALSNAQSKVAQAQANLTQAQSTLTEAQAKLADAVAKVQECTAAVETATANYNAAKAARDAAKAAYDACQVPALVESTDPTTGKVTSNASEVAAAEAQKAALAAALQAAEAALAAAQEALSAAQSALSAAQSAQAAAEAEVQAAQAAVQAAQSEVEAAQAAVDAAQAALEEARKLEEAQAKEDEAAKQAAEEALKKAEEAAAAAKAAAEAAAEAAKKAAEAARKAAEDAQKAKEAAAKSQEAAKAAATDVANKRAVQDTTTAKEQAEVAAAAMASSIDHAGEAAGESARAKAIVAKATKNEQEAAAQAAAKDTKSGLINSHLDNVEKNARTIAQSTGADPEKAAKDARTAAGVDYVNGAGKAAVDRMDPMSDGIDAIDGARTAAMAGALLNIRDAAIAKAYQKMPASVLTSMTLGEVPAAAAGAAAAGDQAVVDILNALNNPTMGSKLVAGMTSIIAAAPGGGQQAADTFVAGLVKASNGLTTTQDQSAVTGANTVIGVAGQLAGVTMRGLASQDLVVTAIDTASKFGQEVLTAWDKLQGSIAGTAAYIAARKAFDAAVQHLTSMTDVINTFAAYATGKNVHTDTTSTDVDVVADLKDSLSTMMDGMTDDKLRAQTKAQIDACDDWLGHNVTEITGPDRKAVEDALGASGAKNPDGSSIDAGSGKVYVTDNGKIIIINATGSIAAGTAAGINNGPLQTGSFSGTIAENGAVTGAFSFKQQVNVFAGGNYIAGATKVGVNNGQLQYINGVVSAPPSVSTSGVLKTQLDDALDALRTASNGAGTGSPAGVQATPNSYGGYSNLPVYSGNISWSAQVSQNTAQTAAQTAAQNDVDRLAFLYVSALTREGVAVGIDPQILAAAAAGQVRLELGSSGLALTDIDVKVAAARAGALAAADPDLAGEAAAKEMRDRLASSGLSAVIVDAAVDSARAKAVAAVEATAGVTVLQDRYKDASDVLTQAKDELAAAQKAAAYPAISAGAVSVSGYTAISSVGNTAPTSAAAQARVDAALAAVAAAQIEVDRRALLVVTAIERDNSDVIIDPILAGAAAAAEKRAQVSGLNTPDAVQSIEEARDAAAAAADRSVPESALKQQDQIGENGDPVVIEFNSESSGLFGFNTETDYKATFSITDDKGVAHQAELVVDASSSWWGGSNTFTITLTMDGVSRTIGDGQENWTRSYIDLGSGMIADLRLADGQLTIDRTAVTNDSTGVDIATRYSMPGAEANTIFAITQIEHRTRDVGENGTSLVNPTTLSTEFATYQSHDLRDVGTADVQFASNATVSSIKNTFDAAGTVTSSLSSSGDVYIDNNNQEQARTAKVSSFTPGSSEPVVETITEVSTGYTASRMSDIAEDAAKADNVWDWTSSYQVGQVAGSYSDASGMTFNGQSIDQLTVLQRKFFGGLWTTTTIVDNKGNSFRADGMFSSGMITDPTAPNSGIRAIFDGNSLNLSFETVSPTDMVDEYGTPIMETSGNGFVSVTNNADGSIDVHSAAPAGASRITLTDTHTGLYGDSVTQKLTGNYEGDFKQPTAITGISGTIVERNAGGALKREVSISGAMTDIEWTDDHKIGAFTPLQYTETITASTLAGEVPLIGKPVITTGGRITNTFDDKTNVLTQTRYESVTKIETGANGVATRQIISYTDHFGETLYSDQAFGAGTQSVAPRTYTAEQMASIYGSNWMDSVVSTRQDTTRTDSVVIENALQSDGSWLKTTMIGPDSVTSTWESARNGLAGLPLSMTETAIIENKSGGFESVTHAERTYPDGTVIKSVINQDIADSWTRTTTLADGTKILAEHTGTQREIVNSYNALGMLNTDKITTTIDNNMTGAVAVNGDMTSDRTITSQKIEDFAGGKTTISFGININTIADNSKSVITTETARSLVLDTAHGTLTEYVGSKTVDTLDSMNRLVNQISDSGVFRTYDSSNLTLPGSIDAVIGGEGTVDVITYGRTTGERTLTYTGTEARPASEVYSTTSFDYINGLGTVNSGEKKFTYPPLVPGEATATNNPLAAATGIADNSHQQVYGLSANGSINEKDLQKETFSSVNETEIVAVRAADGTTTSTSKIDQRSAVYDYQGGNYYITGTANGSSRVVVDQQGNVVEKSVSGDKNTWTLTKNAAQTLGASAASLIRDHWSAVLGGFAGKISVEETYSFNNTGFTYDSYGNETGYQFTRSRNIDGSIVTETGESVTVYGRSAVPMSARSDFKNSFSGQMSLNYVSTAYQTTETILTRDSKSVNTSKVVTSGLAAYEQLTSQVPSFVAPARGLAMPSIQISASAIVSATTEAREGFAAIPMTAAIEAFKPVIIAVAAVAAVVVTIATGGMALVPLLTGLGMSAALAAGVSVSVAVGVGLVGAYYAAQYTSQAVDSFAEGDWMGGVANTAFALIAIFGGKAFMGSLGNGVTGIVAGTSFKKVAQVVAAEVGKRAAIGSVAGAAVTTAYVIADHGAVRSSDIGTIFLGGLIGGITGALSPNVGTMLGKGGFTVAEGSFRVANMGMTFVKNTMLANGAKMVIQDGILETADGRFAQGTVSGDVLRNIVMSAIDVAVFFSVPAGGRQMPPVTEGLSFFKGLGLSIGSAVKSTFTWTGAKMGIIGGVTGGATVAAVELANGWDENSLQHVLIGAGIGALVGFSFGNVMQKSGVTSIKDLVAKSTRQESWANIKTAGLGIPKDSTLRGQLAATVNPSEFFPRSVSMVQDIVKFNAFVGIAGTGLNTMTSGAFIDALRATPLDFLDQNGLRLFDQIEQYSASSSVGIFLEKLAVNSVNTISDPKIWQFSVLVGLAQPIIGPLLVNSPVLGTSMQTLSWIGNDGLSILFQNHQGAIATMIHRVISFGWEEGVQEVAPGIIGGQIFRGNQAASEVFQEMFDKTPDGASLQSKSALSQIQQGNPNMTSDNIQKHAQAIAQAQQAIVTGGGKTSALTDRADVVAMARQQLGLTHSNGELGLTDMGSTESSIAAALTAAVVIERVINDAPPGSIKVLGTRDAAQEVNESLRGMVQESLSFEQNVNYLHGAASMMAAAGSHDIFSADGNFNDKVDLNKIADAPALSAFVQGTADVAVPGIVLAHQAASERITAIVEHNKTAVESAVTPEGRMDASAGVTSMLSELAELSKLAKLNKGAVNADRQRYLINTLIHSGVITADMLRTVEKNFEQYIAAYEELASEKGKIPSRDQQAQLEETFKQLKLGDSLGSIDVQGVVLDIPMFMFAQARLQERQGALEGHALEENVNLLSQSGLEVAISKLALEGPYLLSEGQYKAFKTIRNSVLKTTAAHLKDGGKQGLFDRVKAALASAKLQRSMAVLGTGEGKTIVIAGLTPALKYLNDNLPTAEGGAGRVTLHLADIETNAINIQKGIQDLYGTDGKLQTYLYSNNAPNAAEELQKAIAEGKVIITTYGDFAFRYVTDEKDMAAALLKGNTGILMMDEADMSVFMPKAMISDWSGAETNELVKRVFREMTTEKMTQGIRQSVIDGLVQVEKSKSPSGESTLEKLRIRLDALSSNGEKKVAIVQEELDVLKTTLEQGIKRSRDQIYADIDKYQTADKAIKVALGQAKNAKQRAKLVREQKVINGTLQELNENLKVLAKNNRETLAKINDLRSTGATNADVTSLLRGLYQTALSARIMDLLATREGADVLKTQTDELANQLSSDKDIASVGNPFEFTSKTEGGEKVATGYTLHEVLKNVLTAQLTWVEGVNYKIEDGKAMLITHGKAMELMPEVGLLQAVEARHTLALTKVSPRDHSSAAVIDAVQDAFGAIGFSGTYSRSVEQAMEFERLDIGASTNLSDLDEEFTLPKVGGVSVDGSFATPAEGFLGSFGNLLGSILDPARTVITGLKTEQKLKSFTTILDILELSAVKKGSIAEFGSSVTAENAAAMARNKEGKYRIFIGVFEQIGRGIDIHKAKGSTRVDLIAVDPQLSYKSAMEQFVGRVLGNRFSEIMENIHVLFVTDQMTMDANASTADIRLKAQGESGWTREKFVELFNQKVIENGGVEAESREIAQSGVDMRKVAGAPAVRKVSSVQEFEDKLKQAGISDAEVKTFVDQIRQDKKLFNTSVLTSAGQSVAYGILQILAPRDAANRVMSAENRDAFYVGLSHLLSIYDDGQTDEEKRQQENISINLPVIMDLSEGKRLAIARDVATRIVNKGWDVVSAGQVGYMAQLLQLADGVALKTSDIDAIMNARHPQGLEQFANDAKAGALPSASVMVVARRLAGKDSTAPEALKAQMTAMVQEYDKTVKMFDGLVEAQMKQRESGLRQIFRGQQQDLRRQMKKLSKSQNDMTIAEMMSQAEDVNAALGHMRSGINDIMLALSAFTRVGDDDRRGRQRMSMADINIVSALMADDKAKTAVSGLRVSQVAGISGLNVEERLQHVNDALHSGLVDKATRKIRSALGRPAAKQSPMEMAQALETAGISGNIIARVASPVLAERLDKRAESTDTSLEGALNWLQEQFRTEKDNASAVEGLSALQSLGALRPEGVLKLQQIISPSASPRADQTDQKAVSPDDQNAAIRVLVAAINNPHASLDLVSAAHRALRTFTETDAAQDVIGEYNALQQSMSTDKPASAESLTANDDMLNQFRQMMQMADMPEVIADQALEKFAQGVVAPAPATQAISKQHAVIALGLAGAAVALAATGVLAPLAPFALGAFEGSVGSLLNVLLASVAGMVLKKSSQVGPRKSDSKKPLQERLKSAKFYKKQFMQLLPSIVGSVIGTMLGSPMTGLALATGGFTGVSAGRSLIRGEAKEDMGRTLAMASLAVDRDPAIAGKISDSRMKAFEKYVERTNDVQAKEAFNKLSDRRGTPAVLETVPVPSPLEKAAYALVAGTELEDALPWKVLGQAVGMESVQLKDAADLSKFTLPEGSVVILYMFETKQADLAPGEVEVGHAVAVTAIDGDNVTVFDRADSGALEQKTVSIAALQTAGFAGLMLVNSEIKQANFAALVTKPVADADKEKLVVQTLPEAAEAGSAVTEALAAAADAAAGNWHQQVAQKVVDILNERSAETGIVAHCALVAAAQVFAAGLDVAGDTARAAAKKSILRADHRILVEIQKDLLERFSGATADEKMLISAIWGVTNPNDGMAEERVRLALAYQPTRSFSELESYFEKAKSSDQVMVAYARKVNTAMDLSKKGLITEVEFQTQLIRLSMYRDLMLAGIKNDSVKAILNNSEIAQEDVSKLLSVLGNNRMSVAAQCLAYVASAQQKPAQDDGTVNLEALRSAVATYQTNKGFWDTFSAAGQGKIIRNILNANGIGMEGNLKKRGTLPDPLAMRGFISAA